MERMQRVLDASIGAIGEEKSLYDLAHNFLVLGKFAQAHKLFETPGLRYNQNRIEYVLERLQEKNLLEAIFQLVRLTKGLFGCDRGLLYRRLSVAVGSDADKAMEVWVMMQEEGHPPSNAVRTQIAKVLRAAGREVPFEEPAQRERQQDKDKESSTTPETSPTSPA